MVSDKIITLDKLEFILNKDCWDGYEFQKRRHDDWKENYELFRDKVIINRLTQRQSVNIPLMKQIVKTLLSKIDDFVDLQFTNLSNDEQKQLFYNSYWNDVVKKENRLEIKDKVDKKQVMLFGRSFEKLNVMHGKVKVHIVDPYDMRVDRYVDPTDLDSAGYLVQDNIFETLSDLKGNAMYDKAAVTETEEFFSTAQGLVKSNENEEQLRKKNEAMKEMGDNYVDNPNLGQTLVQMQEGFIKVYNPEIQESEIIFTLSGAIQREGKPYRRILYAEALETVIDPNGNCPDHFWRNHYPFESWGEDIENRDFWNDGVADSVRPPNKVVNSWFSQTVENRTMRNFGMNYYNSTISGEDGMFIPQTFEPKAWGWYGVPGNPNDIIKSVEIPQLTGNLEEINFVVQVAEKASAATAITQGVSEPKKITLGEVELLSANALDRIQSMSLYYQQAWLNLGNKYIKLLEAMGNEIDAVKLFKVGKNGKQQYGKSFSPASWKDKLGYSCEVVSKKDKSEKDLEQMQKLNAIKSFMPNNRALMKVIQAKLLDMGNLTPDETKVIMDEEENNVAAAGMITTTNPAPTTPLTNVTPKPIMNKAQPPMMATA
jgi:galactitol-specific phosphotransferase system IIB component